MRTMSRCGNYCYEEMRIRKHWKILSVALLALLVALEIALRGMYGFGSPPLMHADPDYGYAFNANQDLRRFGNRIHYNGLGLRSGEISMPKPAGQLRVLCIGDSVTNGGVLAKQSLTYPSLLEAELKAADLPARVLNASAGSWAVQNQLAFLRKRGLFDADIVVVQIGTHDLFQPKSTGDVVGNDPCYPDHNPLLALQEVAERYVAPRLERLLSVDQAKAAPRDDDHAVSLGAAEELVLLVRSEGARPIILLTPNREELERPLTAVKWRSGLFTLARRLDVAVVDVLPSLRASKLGAGVLYRDWVHPTPEANGIIARAVAGGLTGNGLLRSVQR